GGGAVGGGGRGRGGGARAGAALGEMGPSVPPDRGACGPSAGKGPSHPQPSRLDLPASWEPASPSAGSTRVFPGHFGVRVEGLPGHWHGRPARLVRLSSKPDHAFGGHSPYLINAS